ncbi:hypothetical protein AJ88_12230 [Mesorhizobium amorphae CCBAU 01583]|nr:hypothetical protein AJ88_12230 [Mesorhizobium amorphae CCBAU 01583]
MLGAAAVLRDIFGTRRRIHLGKTPFILGLWPAASLEGALCIFHATAMNLLCDPRDTWPIQNRPRSAKSSKL